jgi:hypothetical protein
MDASRVLTLCFLFCPALIDLLIIYQTRCTDGNGDGDNHQHHFYQLPTHGQRTGGLRLESQVLPTLGVTKDE